MITYSHCLIRSLESSRSYWTWLILLRWMRDIRLLVFWICSALRFISLRILVRPSLMVSEG